MPSGLYNERLSSSSYYIDQDSSQLTVNTFTVWLTLPQIPHQTQKNPTQLFLFIQTYRVNTGISGNRGAGAGNYGLIHSRERAPEVSVQDWVCRRGPAATVLSISAWSQCLWKGRSGANSNSHKDRKQRATRCSSGLSILSSAWVWTLVHCNSNEQLSSIRTDSACTEVGLYTSSRCLL